MASDPLDVPLHSVVRREAISCTPQTPIREALETMRRLGVGSIFVTDEARRPLGVVTLKEVLSKVALQQPDLARSVASVMSTELYPLPPQAPAYEAALAMARHGIRHVPLVEGGRLQGVVSESNLFYLQRIGLRPLTAAIRAATSVAALESIERDVRDAVRAMLAQGAGAEHVTQFISTVNDLVMRRVIELESEGASIPGAACSWIVMGSQGRFEQSLATDQDNGIIFAHPENTPADAVRARLLPLARRVNEALDRAGIPLCRGNIMASNPECCLSLAEWKARFADWIGAGDPQALLNATIYFDFRPVAGELRLGEALREWLAEVGRDNSRFLFLMAQNALANQPPLGLFRDFILPGGGDHRHTLDLKVNGITPFVDAARIHSLAAGVTETSTVQRLRGAGARLGMSRNEVEAWVEAFSFIQHLRLRHQARSVEEGRAPENHIDPDTLNEMDRRVLKEAMRQARRLQSRLVRDHALVTPGFGA
jgi:CBS domain-containing protein